MPGSFYLYGNYSAFNRRGYTVARARTDILWNRSRHQVLEDTAQHRLLLVDSAVVSGYCMTTKKKKKERSKKK